MRKCSIQMNQQIPPEHPRHGLNNDAIAVAAYYLWEHSGRPEGLDKLHWQRAIEPGSARTLGRMRRMVNYLNCSRNRLDFSGKTGRSAYRLASIAIHFLVKS